VLSFNNRGHGIVSRIHYGKRQLLAGSAHEIFRDSVDDIRGAVDFAKKNGARDIYIAGHSTGCQKAVLYSSKLPTRARVKGLILFGPVSDHAVAVRDDRHGRLSKAVGIARRLVRTGRPHEMMPRALRTKWSINDAQRFLSLYTPDSAETIFSYEQPKKIPSALHAIKIPQLILWAKRDEYADRPAKEIAAWFEKHVRKGRIVIVPKVGHGFKGGERFVARQIKEFMKE
jgi:pimeloyl-ACP methyl ester carboxylesterase